MKTYETPDSLSMAETPDPYESDDWFLILLLLACTMNHADPEKIKMEELNDDKQEPYSCNPEQAS